MVALAAALQHLQTADAEAPATEVRICTDSQSALMRLSEGSSAQTDHTASEVWKSLRVLADRGMHVTLQWVPAHSGLAGNEAADDAAADLDQLSAPIDLPSAKSGLKRHAHQEWEERLKSTRYYTENGPRRVVPGDRLGLSLQESVEVARLRTGHSMLLRYRRHKMGLDTEAVCPECELDDETLSHLLTDCPARAGLRRRVFGRDDPTVREALSDPHSLVDFLRRLGRL